MEARVVPRRLLHASVDECVVVERTAADGSRVFLAYLVSAAPLNLDAIGSALRSVVGANDVRPVPVASIPLRSDGTVDLEALARIPVITTATTAAWEEALRSRVGAGVALVVDERQEPALPLHLADLLPDRVEQPLGSTGPAQPAVVPETANSSNRPLALAVGDPLPPAPAANLPEALQAAARLDATITYIAADGTETQQSYRDLLANARRLASGLRRHGVAVGDFVLLQAGAPGEFIPAFWGCQMAGVVPIPVAPASPYGSGAAATEAMVRSWEVMDRPPILSAASVRARVVEAFAARGDRPRILELEALDGPEDGGPSAGPDPEAIAACMMTSGSTGMPKGVLLSHRALISQAQGSILSNGLTPADAVLNWAPLDHVGGLSACHLVPMLIGAHQTQCDGARILEDPLRWLDLMSTTGCTATFAPNFAFALINERLGSAPGRTWDLRHVKAFWNAGEAVVARTARRFLRLLAPHGLSPRAMRPAWGMSETCSGLTYSSAFDFDTTGDDDLFVDVGAPNPGTALRIVAADGSPAREGDEGALEVSGMSLMAGYFRNPTATAAAFTADGWFRTGDLGRVVGGRLTVTGRLKDVLIVNGVNLHCHEVESVVDEVDGVVPSYTAACAVRGSRDATDRVVIFLHTNRSDVRGQRQVVASVRAEVARRFGVPPDYVLLVDPDRIPRTNLGKIKRPQLSQAFSEGAFAVEQRWTDRLEGNHRTIPDWFVRPVWRARALDGPFDPDGSATVVVFVDSLGVGDRIGTELARAARKWIAVVPGSGFAALGPGRYAIDPEAPDDARRLAAELARQGQTIGPTLHAWGIEPPGPPPSDDAASRRAVARTTGSVLHWIQALAEADARAATARVIVAATGVQRLEPGEPVVAERAAALGLVKSAPRELPWLECRHLDIDDVMAAAPLMIRELDSAAADQEVAYRRGTRLVARLAPVEWPAPTVTTPAFRTAGLYLIAGGLGGIGSEVAARLLREFDARLLLVGRTPLDRLDAERAAAWTELRSIGDGRVRYVAADLADGPVIRAAVQEAAAGFGRPLAGAIHMAGGYDDRPVMAETIAGLIEPIAPRLLGGRVLASLLDREDQVLITVSSAAGWFGGAAMTAYTAASRVAEALALELGPTLPGRVHHLAWSAWRDTGVSRKVQDPEPHQARRYLSMTRAQGWHSLLAGLGFTPGLLIVGLNRSHRQIRRFLVEERSDLQTVRLYLEASCPQGPQVLHDAFGSACHPEIRSLPALPRTDAGAIDRRALADAGRAGGSRDFVPPRTAVERELAAIWTELLGLDQVGRTDPFLEMGGHSLVAAQLVSRIREAFGVAMPLATVFAEPTIEAQAQLIEQARNDTKPAAAPPAARRDPAPDQRSPNHPSNPGALGAPGGGRSSMTPVDPKRELLLRLLRQRGLEPSQLPIVRRARPGELVPLSFSQERLWFLHQMDPAAASYHLTFDVAFDQAMEPAVMRESLRQLLERHEILRTTYHDVDGRPMQRVETAWEASVEAFDLTGAAGPVRDTELRAIATRIGQTPFDLVRGPVIRAALVRTGPASSHLYLAVHHIAVDGLSLGILFRELTDTSAAIAAGTAPQLPALPIQYADYSLWQRETLSGSLLERHLDYWRGRLAGATGLELYPDRPRPSRPSYRGGNIVRDLPAALVADLQALARREGATFFMVLLAAFKTLLHRYTGSTDIVVGSPVANRDRPEIEPLIGFFVNTLVLRTDASGEPTFREFLRRVRETSLGAFDHQALPFEKLVQEVVSERDLSRNPLFQIMFGLHKTGREDLRFGDDGEVAGGMDDQATRFDLEVVVSATDEATVLSFVYASDLFDAATIEALAEHFVTVAAAAARDPDQPIGRLPVMTEAERHRVTVEWNDTAKDYPSACLHQLVEAQVARSPDAIAVEAGTASLTYRELDQRATALARWLAQQGVGPDRLVAVSLDRSLEMVVALLGVLKAGGAYVPVDPSYPEARVRHMLVDSAASIVLTQADIARFHADLGATVLCLDTEWDRVVATPDTVPFQPPGPSNLAYVIFTSGSTGQPKGAMNEHRGIVNRLRWMQDTFGLGPDDAVLQKTPFSFDVSVWEFFWPLMTGARLVMARPDGHRDPGYLAGVIGDRRITTLHFVPSMLRAFLASGHGPGLTGVRRVICSGEALPPDLARRHAERWGVPLHNLYGPTEAAVDVTWWPVASAEAGSAIPIGRPIANTTVSVLDARQLPVPPGVPGELYLGGVQVGRGYWRRPELTAERFVPDPLDPSGTARLYRTGDLVRWRRDGALDFLGRIDHQVKLRGFRIELGEIETALAAAPGVGSAVVTLREDTPGDARLVAYVVPGPGTAPTLEGIRRALASTLPDYMIPSALVTLERIPVSPSGKADLKALPAPEVDLAALRGTYLAPRDSTEATLATIWEQVLGVPRVGVRDNFFTLGGHSLLATLLVSRVRDQLGIEIPLRTVFEEPTVEGMALAALQLKAAGTDAGEVDRLLRELEQSAS